MAKDIESKKAEDIFSDLEYSPESESKKIEQPAAAEAKAEKAAEIVQEKGDKTESAKEAVVAKEPVLEQSNAAVVAPAVKTDVVYQEVEKVLEEDLADIYFKLPEAARAEFKKQGEVTASKVTLLLKSTRVKIKEIFILIINWLKIIPGVNVFFLEQEAKIKTSKLLSIKNKGIKDKQ
jgi:hypothetical protein